MGPIDPTRTVLTHQLAMAWQLAWHHLATVTTAELLWRPAATGLHVHRRADGGWQADWPTHERYDLGPSSLAWLGWHWVFWWSMALDHNFGAAGLTRDQVRFAGDADGLRSALTRLHAQWADRLAALDGPALAATAAVRWPFAQRSMADLFAWANTELAKSAAEFGYVRFLYAARPAAES